MNRPTLATPTSGGLGEKCAFTLIELLVTVAVIGILASLILPALSRAKSQAQGTFCQNNTRQLIIGCLLYCDENGGYFPYNMVSNAVHSNINWACDVMDWDTNSDNTNLSELITNAMGPYLSRSTSVYRCPSDSALATIQHNLGWRNRARSYSMNGSVGNIGDIMTKGVNPNNPDYVQFLKLSSVPVASKIFVFIEEHPDTIYDGYFINKIDSEEWYRLPASYHNRSANLSYADGHAELHRWQDSWTMPPAETDGAFPIVWVPLPEAQQPDFYWLADHMSVEAPAAPATAW